MTFFFSKVEIQISHISCNIYIFLGTIRLVVNISLFFLQQGATETFQSVSESGLEVEYQVPTSSQRDHEEEADAVILVESDEDADMPDEGEGVDDDADEADTEGYDEGVSYPVSI